MKATDTDTHSLARLVHFSVTQYGEMAELLRALQQLESNPVGCIEEFNVTFVALQKKARQVDQELLELLSRSDDLDSSVEQDLGRRWKLQADILKMLEQTLPRAMSIKSLLASEIHSLKAGRSALTGYKNHSAENQGKLINKRS